MTSVCVLHQSDQGQSIMHSCCKLADGLPASLMHP